MRSRGHRTRSTDSFAGIHPLCTLVRQATTTERMAAMTQDPEVPSTARMIDYWLGGKHPFPVAVAAADAFEAAYGSCAAIFRSLRDFSGRTVAYLSAHGIDNFLVF